MSTHAYVNRDMEITELLFFNFKDMLCNMETQLDDLLSKEGTG